jgi:hypothetical protein
VPALRPAALAVLRLLGDGVAAIGHARPLLVRSTPSAAPTGWSFEIARRYRSATQAQAFQFMLDRLQALDVIAWARHGMTIRVTASARAAGLLKAAGAS